MNNDLAMTSNVSVFRLFMAACLCGFTVACTTVAPPYTASVANVDVTAKLAAAIAVGKFDYDKGREGELNQVGARAGIFLSPFNNSYADYFVDAAIKELKAAGRYDAAAGSVLTGTLLENHLSAAGPQVNECELQVRFRLTQGDRTLYEKVVQANNEWESSVLGGIAIPRALNQYIVTIQKLLRNLFADPAFGQAVALK